LEKAPPSPGDRGVDKIEGRDLRAGRGKRLGVVSEPAADIERAETCERPFSREPVDEQRMRRKIAPGHAGGVAFRQPIDRLEPVAAQRIGVDPALSLMRVDRVEPCPRGLAARREILRQAPVWRAFSSHFPSSLSCR
jgi:hypothetical protein